MSELDEKKCGKGKKAMTEEILVDLILDDIVNETSLVEAGNPNHDASGKFTNKSAVVAHQFGIMAAGRAAGIRAKAEGLSHKEIRKAIRGGMRNHMEQVAINRGEQPSMAKIRSRLRYNGGRNATKAQVRGVGTSALAYARKKVGEMKKTAE